MPSLILGSSSPARAMQLKQLGLTFKQISPNINETAKTKESPREMALRLAHEKNEAIEISDKSAIIVTGDLVIELNQSILGKPITHKRAVEQLLRCSGQTISAYSAMVVRCKKSQLIHSCCIETKAHFRKLNVEMIEKYLNDDKPYHCAGSIKIESRGMWLIESLTSDDPSAIIGLPILSLIGLLDQMQLLDHFFFNTQPSE